MDRKEPDFHNDTQATKAYDDLMFRKAHGRLGEDDSTAYNTITPYSDLTDEERWEQMEADYDD